MGTVLAPLAAATRQAPPVPRTDLRPRGSRRRGLHRGDLAVAGGCSAARTRGLVAPSCVRSPLNTPAPPSRGVSRK